MKLPIAAIAVAYAIGSIIQFVSDDPALGAFINAMVIICMTIVMFNMENRLAKHQEALRWYANHVKIDPHFRSEPMPEMLQSLVEDEDETAE